MSMLASRSAQKRTQRSPQTTSANFLRQRRELLTPCARVDSPRRLRRPSVATPSLASLLPRARLLQPHRHVAEVRDRWLVMAVVLIAPNDVRPGAWASALEEYVGHDAPAGLQHRSPGRPTGNGAARQGFPTARAFATKTELARSLVVRALASPLPIAWVTADALYGQDRHFRRMLVEAGLGYVVAAPGDLPPQNKPLYGQDTRHALRWSCFPRQHQATAMRCHYKRRTAGHELPPREETSAEYAQKPASDA